MQHLKLKVVVGFKPDRKNAIHSRYTVTVLYINYNQRIVIGYICTKEDIACLLLPNKLYFSIVHAAFILVCLAFDSLSLLLQYFSRFDKLDTFYIHLFDTFMS